MGRTIHKLKAIFLKPRHILVVDLFGAIVTTLVTVFLLASERLQTGLPTWLLYSMALVAFGFVCFDVAAIFQFLDAPVALATIAYLNVSYCLAVLLVLCVYRMDITKPCLVYFCFEIGIVTPLAWWEWSISRRRYSRSFPVR